RPGARRGGRRPGRRADPAAPRGRLPGLRRRPLTRRPDTGTASQALAWSTFLASATSLGSNPASWASEVAGADRYRRAINRWLPDSQPTSAPGPVSAVAAAVRL